MERPWHDSPETLSAGGCQHDHGASDRNLWEVKRRLIRWGADAEVIKPSYLFDEIRDECRKIVSRSS
jgi:hypothetical protein